MKNFKLVSMLLAAASLLLASCSIDNLSSVEIDDGEECMVSFTVQVPSDMDSKTRTTPDEPPMDLPEDPDYPTEPVEPVVQPIVPGGATKITKLSYFVYETVRHDNHFFEKWTPLEMSGTVDMTGLTATVNINLLRGIDYRVVFWADSFGISEESPYQFNPQTYEMTMDFNGLQSNREDLDAFYGVADVDNAATGKTHTVTLTRPFAQLNIGMDMDKIKALNVSSIQTAIEVTCANAINVKDDELKGEGTFKYELAAAPSATEYLFPYKPETYSYLSLNYIPVIGHQEATAVKLNYVVNDNLNLTRSLNVPMSRNFRTNVYGDLLSASSKLEVTIDPIFSYRDNEGDRDTNKEFDPTLTALHDAGKYGGEYKLTEDVALLSSVIVEQDLVVDLNGYTVSMDAPENGKNIIFYVESGTRLTIKGLGQVKAISDSATNYAILVADSYYNTQVNIESGSFVGDITTENVSHQSEANIQISGGGFTNYSNPYLEDYLIGDLQFTQLGDWNCVISEEVPTTPAVDGWIEDLDDFLWAIRSHDYDISHRYLYTSNGVSYVVYHGHLIVYPSSCGWYIDLGYQPFAEHSGLSQITINEGIIAVREYTFFASGSNSITLPSSLCEIGEYAFCYAVKGKLTIPGNVRVISEGAFKNSSLSKVIVEEGVEIVEAEAFEQNSLIAIQFASTVKKFGSKCLNGNNSLMAVVFLADSFEADASIFSYPGNSAAGGIYVYVQDSMMDKAEEMWGDLNYVTIKHVSEFDQTLL